MASSFKNVNVVKDEEKMGNSSRLKETKEMWKLNEICDPGMDQ